MRTRMAILVTGTLVAFSGLRAQVDTDLLDAFGKYYSGKYTEAIGAFDKLISANRNSSPDFYLYRGISGYRVGFYQQALDDLIAAADLGQIDAYLWMARCFILLDDFSESISRLETYLQLSPSPAVQEIKSDSVFRALHSSDAWYELWQSDWRSASQKAIEEAEYFAGKENYTEAHGIIERAIEQGTVELFLYNSTLYARENNPELAINELNRALSDFPDDLKLMRKKAEYLVLLMDYREAYELWTRVLARTPEDFHSRYSRAGAAYYSGILADARSDISLFLNYQENENALFLAGNIAYASGQYLDALRHFNRLLEETKGNAQFFKARGMTYYQTRTLNQAAYDLSMSLDLVPDDAEANYFLGLTQDLLGNKRMACYYLTRAKNYGDTRSTEYLQKNCSD